MPDTIAFLGTGLLGSGFIEAALGRGETVTVWNRTRAKAEPLAARGARVADTPADAVRGAARVHLVLSDDDAVESVIDALRPGLASEAIIVDHTTTLPRRTAARAERLAAEGVRYLHCPVFISPAAARQTQGMILAAGPADLFAAVEPALRRQAAEVRYLGARPDVAAVHKLAGNAFNIGMVGLVADTLTLAKAEGVDGAEILSLLEWFDSRKIVGGRGKLMLARNYAPSFELGMAAKDLRLMQESAGELPLAMLPGLAARM
ncbi:MAG TPA: NAD(P)-binding domain-containing protein, partial [Gemmatimonadales bacterium]|nr:NAD(P)-binding domain-containing protein [Gemmatimonadales bacterium]